MNFNSKEQQEISGWLDYGWRMYDAVIERWGGVDPMAETNLSFSPFNYCSSNAINRIDPDGAWDDSWLLNIATGELSWWNSQGGKEFQMIHVVSPASNGGLLHLGTSILEGSMSKYFLGSYSGGFAFSTRDYWKDLDFNLRGYKGYQYDMDDLKMRYKVLNSGLHHLKVALLSMENRGWAEPLTSYNYWNTYGHTLGMLNLMGTYIPAGVGVSAAAQGGGDYQRQYKGEFFKLTFQRPANTDVYIVAPNGIILPKGAYIPKGFVMSEHRAGLYGFRVNGKFDKEIFRIDPATPKGFKGSDRSHIHINNGKHKYT